MPRRRRAEFDRDRASSTSAPRYGRRGRSDGTLRHSVTTVVDSGERLRRQNRVLADLARRQSVHAGLDAALRDVAVAAAEALETDRVSIWFFTAGRAALRCAEVYERAEARHAEGEELLVSAYPSYVHAVETERSIAAHDALS